MLAKRFIAGAVCPKCQMRDKIRLEKQGDKQIMDCVNCGFMTIQENASLIDEIDRE